MSVLLPPLSWRQLFSALVGVVVASAARADLIQTIDLIKPSIVAIVAHKANANLPNSIRGTGFVVGDGSLVATNAHVIHSITADAGSVILVQVRLSAVEGQLRPAHLVGVDDDHDLALLRVEGGGLPPLQLGESETVREGLQIAFTGFPIGAFLGFTPVTHRGIVSAITPIAIPAMNSRGLNEAAVQRIRRGPFRIFQMDATAYPGNSGSPMYDPETGTVLGIVNLVFVKSSKEAMLSQPSGITYAIPVVYLKNLIASVSGK